MNFGAGLNYSYEQKLAGRQIDIACKCWFTSTGRAMPLMIKYKDEKGAIQISAVMVHSQEEKNYCGIPTTEFRCDIFYHNRKRDVKLIFFKEESRWVMLL